MDRHPGPENSEKRQKSEAKRPHCKSAGFAYAGSNPALPTTLSYKGFRARPLPRACVKVLGMIPQKKFAIRTRKTQECRDPNRRG